MASIVDNKKIREEGKSPGTKNLVYKGKLQTFNWYEIPTDLLKYNFLNGRIGSEVKEFNQLGKI